MIKNIILKSINQLKGKIIKLAVITFIMTALNMVGSLIPILNLFITPLISFSIVLLYYKLATSDYTPDIGDVFGGLKNLSGAMRVVLANSIFIVLWGLLFIIPGLIKAYSYSQALYILAENPEIGGREALEKSSNMMRGHKFELFLLQMLFIVPVFVAIIVIAFAIRNFLLPLMLFPIFSFFLNLLMTNYYLEISVSFSSG